ncbi:hypothetical protein TRQ7_09245 [Thermotoga sp. RQ7]|uniref:hypothetical protein n=1 Tax=Thermotoga sp. RQ7 TaxID=126738 RepID=UPI0005A30495|nr:hypothetical protein [Thermotoga sp. RQ7]AJG41625.1 hypothetical protein TRQ7_09245 [Thermotoga sp. RQ7]
MIKRTFLLIFSVLVVSSFAGVLHFEHADIVYPEGYYENAVLVGKIFETIRPKVVELVGNDPGRITIVLKDKGTVSNGYTMPFFHRTIVIYLWPPEGWMHFQLPLEDWYTYVLIHEFSHMCHLTYQGDLEKTLTELTGIPLYPQIFGGLIEGVTLFNESSFSSSSGRLNNPFYSDGLFYYSLSNFPSPSYSEIAPEDDYRGSLLYYNFTGGFYRYLVETYGLEKVKEFFRESSKIMSGDAYRKVFGKSLNEIYTDWIFSLTNLSYDQGDLIYTAKNTRLYKLDLFENNLVVLSEEYGPFTSYTGMKKESLRFIDLDGKKVKEIPLENTIDVKYDDGKIYALCKERSFDRYENVLWDVTERRIVEKGNISAFAVQNGRVYLSFYDPESMKSIVKGPRFEYVFDGFVRYMDVSEDYIVLLTLDNRIVVLDRKTRREVSKIDTPEMKGPYVRFWKDGVIFVQVEEGYTIPCYYDLKEKRLYSLAEKTLLSDFLVEGDTLYYTSYVPYGKTGGMGVYRKALKIKPMKTSEEDFHFSKEEAVFTTSSETLFRIKKFLRPVLHVPLYVPEVRGEGVAHNFSFLLGFSGVENDVQLFLAPNVNSKDGFSQYVGLSMVKDTFTAYGSYVYPHEIYSLGLSVNSGRFMLSPSSVLELVLGMSFDSIGLGVSNTLDVIPNVKSKNVGAGLGLKTYLLDLPVSLKTYLTFSSEDIEDLFTLDSLYSFNELKVALGRESSFSVRYDFKLTDPGNFRYDISLAHTLFEDQAELFDGLVLVKNTGNTIGITSLELSSKAQKVNVLYDHIFMETYTKELKFYLTAGAFLNLSPSPDSQPAGFYIGISTSPNGFPSFPAFIDLR